MTTSQIGASHSTPGTIFANIDVLVEAKDKENYSALLSNIKLVDSSAVSAFKKQSNETFLAHKAFDDLVQSSLPSEFRNAKLSDKGEGIKNLLGIISPHISTQKDKDTFNLIIKTLIKANGKEKKEQVVDKALSKLVISCGKAPFEACLAKFYALCVEAWKAHYPDMQGDMTHDRVFTPESSRIFAMLNFSVSNMTREGNDWTDLEHHTVSFKAYITALAKTLKFVEAPNDPQPANQVPNPERPAVSIPNAGLGDGMKGMPHITVYGSSATGGTGGNASITGGNHSPDARSHGGFDLNAALETILTNDGLTEANRVKLSNDAMDLYRDFLKANSGVLSNLSSVTGHAPESMPRNPSTQNNSASLHDTSTGNDATASLAGMPAGSASQVSDGSELQAELQARLLDLRSFDKPLVDAGQSSTDSASTSATGARARSASLASNGSDQTAEQLDTDAVSTSAAGARARSASLASNGSDQTAEQLDTDAVSTSAAGAR
ncbi:hypothetical protein, partial [Pectobacterium brasiliense]|uniref:hypothetical protein n=1 Tax=Pectobacterium brasiliense TaxID=180957 RepID=UPI0013DFFA8F